MGEPVAVHFGAVLVAALVAVGVACAAPSTAGANHVSSSLTVVKSPPEGGSVTAPDGGGIDCGTDCTESYEHYVICEYDLGFENCYDGWGGALLKAAPAPGWLLDGWTNCPELSYEDCNAVVWPGEGDLTVIARFRRAECSDGVDNDADSLVDLADAECTSISDDSETVGPLPPGPLEEPPVTVTPADIGVTADTTPMVEFSSPMPGVRYSCVIQYRPPNASSYIKEVVNPCTSPYTTPRLHNGNWEITITGMNPSGRAVTEVRRRLTVAAPGAPDAQFSYACSGTVCYFNALASRDPDGYVAEYRWDFDDGSSASGGYVRKVFANGAGPVRLTVTDDTGAGASREQWLILLHVQGRAFLSGGFATVELSWNGAPGALYWIYRGSKRVGAIVGTKLVDRPPASPSGAFSYSVCSASGEMCSATETFRLEPAGL